MFSNARTATEPRPSHVEFAALPDQKLIPDPFLTKQQRRILNLYGLFVDTLKLPIKEIHAPMGGRPLGLEVGNHGTKRRNQA